MDFIYDDILTERDDSARKDLIQQEETRERNHREQIRVLETEREQLKKKLAHMEESLQTLLKTARAEVARKDARIAELKRQVDDLAFRRAVRTGHREEFEKVFQVAHGKDRQEREDSLAGKLIREYLSGPRAQKRRRQLQQSEEEDLKQSEPAAKKVRKCETVSSKRRDSSSSLTSGNNSEIKARESVLEPVREESSPNNKIEGKTVDDPIDKDKSGNKNKLSGDEQDRGEIAEKKDGNVKEQKEGTPLRPKSESRGGDRSSAAKNQPPAKEERSDRSGLMKSLFGSDSPEKAPQPPTARRELRRRNSEIKKESSTSRRDRQEDKDSSTKAVSKSSSDREERRRDGRKSEKDGSRELDRSKRSRDDRSEKRENTSNNSSSRGERGRRDSRRHDREDLKRDVDRDTGSQRSRFRDHRRESESERRSDRRGGDGRQREQDGQRERTTSIKDRSQVKEQVGPKEKTREETRERRDKDGSQVREQQVGSKEKTREDTRECRDKKPLADEKESEVDKTETGQRDINPKDVVSGSGSDKSDLAKDPQSVIESDREEGEISEDEKEEVKAKCEKTSYKIPRKPKQEVKRTEELAQQPEAKVDNSGEKSSTHTKVPKKSPENQMGTLNVPASKESTIVASKGHEEMVQADQVKDKAVVEDAPAVVTEESTAKSSSPEQDAKRRPNLTKQSTNLSTPVKACERKRAESGGSGSPLPSALASVEDMDSTELEDLLEQKRREFDGLAVEKEECIQRLSNNPSEDAETFVRRISPRKHMGTKPLDDSSTKKKPSLKLRLKRTPPSASTADNGTMEGSEYQPEFPAAAADVDLSLTSEQGDAATLPNPPDLTSPEAIANMLKGKLAHGAHVSPVSGIIKTPTTSNPSSRRYPLRRSSRVSLIVFTASNNN